MKRFLNAIVLSAICLYASGSQAIGIFSAGKFFISSATYVAPAFVSSANAAGSGSTVVINKPAGTVSGNLMIAFLSNFNADTFTTPSGWTLQASGADSIYTTLYVFSKVAGGAEPSTYTFSNFTTDANFSSGAIVTYSGGSGPLVNVVGGSMSIAASTPLSITAITPTQSGTLLAIASTYVPAGASSASGFVSRVYANPTNAGLALLDKTNTSTSSTGAVSVTWTGSYMLGVLMQIY